MLNASSTSGRCNRMVEGLWEWMAMHTHRVGSCENRLSVQRKTFCEFIEQLEGHHTEAAWQE